MQVRRLPKRDVADDRVLLAGARSGLRSFGTEPRAIRVAGRDPSKNPLSLELVTE